MTATPTPANGPQTAADGPAGRPWLEMSPTDFGGAQRPVQASLFPEADECGTLDLFDAGTDPTPATPPAAPPAVDAGDDHPHRYRYFGPHAGARCVECNDPEPAPATAPPAVLRLTAAVLAGHHTAYTRNEYGSCVEAGFTVALGTDDRARVHHQLPPSDLTDPGRPSSFERWTEMRARVAEYASTLEGDGFTVDVRERPTGPYLLAMPPEAFPCQIGVYCDRCRHTVSHDYLVHVAMTGAQRLQVARDHLARNEGWSCTPAEDVCPSCVAGGGPAADRPASPCTLCDVVKPDVWALRDHVMNVHPDDYCRLYHGPGPACSVEPAGPTPTPEPCDNCDADDAAVCGCCPACDTTRLERCAACGKCRCDRHDGCARPAPAPAGQ
ncbi:hypothetical protein [Streptomyces sp. NPDC056683]|uniref:hypothetical protein n=1 Tax=Streptomyces sp. NPDC056683 TaxID=3345910 RepID=UPI0036B78FD3